MRGLFGYGKPFLLEVIALRIHVGPGSGLAIYQQIVNQVKYKVASGRLQPGDELPPIRALAEQLLINPNTVARAYRELETSGVVTTKQGAGTYISNSGSPLARRERLKILTENVDGLLADAHSMDIPAEEVIEIIRQREESLEAGTEERKTND